MKNFEEIKGQVWRLGFDAETRRFCWQRVGALMENELIDVPMTSPCVGSYPAENLLPSSTGKQSGKSRNAKVREALS